MAFGDGGNDISMLEYVQVGVAMGNSDDPKVLAAASHVAPSVDDDGIARFLHSFLTFEAMKRLALIVLARSQRSPVQKS